MYFFPHAAAGAVNLPATFILGVWNGTRFIGVQEARARFQWLDNESQVDLCASTPEVAAFVQELFSVYPEDDSTVWAAKFKVYQDAAAVSLTMDSFHETAPWIKSAARKQGLICYDPQNDTVQIPTQLYGATPPTPQPAHSFPHPIPSKIAVIAARIGRGEISGSSLSSAAIELIPGTTYYEPTVTKVTWGVGTFYDNSEAARDLRDQLVYQIVENIGPLRVEDAVQWTAAAVGISRIDSQTQDITRTSIARLVKNGQVEIRDGTFLCVSGQCSYPARIAHNEASSRLTASISVEEIAEVAMAAVKAEPMQTRDDLAAEVARLFGHLNPGTNDNSRISAAISGLEFDNRILVSTGHICAL